MTADLAAVHAADAADAADATDADVHAIHRRLRRQREGWLADAAPTVADWTVKEWRGYR